jgi:leucyl-tRNA synthetase
MEYNFREIEKKWQQNWKNDQVYKVSNTSVKPKFYVLDMFPYPSGVGLHVGHPLGYIASDIYARYKRLKGFNVLHPMGYDSFGLPAEQYALETGQHPAVTTENNIKTFRQQLDNIGFCFDWSREVRTSDPKYYKWTQWIFLQLFNSYFCNTQQKARPISELIAKYETKGCNHFTAEEWNAFDEKEKSEWLMKRRLAYSAYGEVNWCEALGTVLANDEVINGVSERGGHPVVKKKMRQWYLRITAYAERLLEGLEKVEFSDAMKEMQRNWIGKSEGAEMEFIIDNSQLTIKVYTTRPDTIFGVDFMVLAPEHELVEKITTDEQRSSIDEYLTYVKSRSDRERMAEVKQVTGAFTGAYAINPFDGRKIPIWIAEYVLAGYGTGAIMAVPCGDQRDFDFANHFNIPVTNIIGEYFNGDEANPTKEATLINSGFLNGIKMRDAIDIVLKKIEEEGIGHRKVNYKMRDAGFSRQRYWGEPFPIVYHNGVAYSLSEDELPVELPHVENYKPGPEGEGPLANITDWVNLDDGDKRETNTMPGYAGSSWYFLRYMDPHNDKEFADRKATDYWNHVDVYVGGTEHAVGHLLYSRMWTKVLYDLGLIGFDEPYKKLVNQGMIQGSSRFVYRINFASKHGTLNIPDIPIFISSGLYTQLQKELITNNELSIKATNEISSLRQYNEEGLIWTSIYELHIDVNIVDGVELDITAFKRSKPEFYKAEFILEDDGKYICGVETEKMSKSKYNTVNPNDLIDKYGADTFRMYEMFLGPVEASKPWDTKGIEGVHRFLKKLWRLFYDDVKGKVWNEEKANGAELKILHKAIKKIEEDTERFSYNTAVSAFMVCVNELTDLKCHKKEILEPLLILLTPYAPHIAEELYHALGNTTTVLDAAYPKLETKYLIESEKEYPVSINGKMRTTINISLDASQDQVEKIALNNEIVQKWIEGKEPKKIIFVKNKMINVVV